MDQGVLSHAYIAAVDVCRFHSAVEPAVSSFGQNISYPALLGNQDSLKLIDTNTENAKFLLLIFKKSIHMYILKDIK